MSKQAQKQALKQAQNITDVLTTLYKRDREGNYIFHNMPQIMQVLKWNNIQDFITYVDDTFGEYIYYSGGRYYLSYYTNITKMNEYFIKEYDKMTNPPRGII